MKIQITMQKYYFTIFFIPQKKKNNKNPTKY